MGKIKINLKEQTAYLKSRVGIDLYVYSGNGELFVNQMPKLGKMELIDHTEKQALANVDRTLTLLQKRLLQQINIYIIRGEDCSGLIVKFLMDKGVIKHDMSANSLFNLFKEYQIPLDQVQEGDYLFQGNDKNKWHIGFAISHTREIESKNHDEGVVETSIEGRGWNYAVRPTWYEDEPTPQKPVLTRELYRTDPLMEGEDVKDCQRLLISKGYNPGKVDGLFGTNTEIAVKNFQIDVKLDINRLGTVGKKTATALGFIWEG